MKEKWEFYQEMGIASTRC